MKQKKIYKIITTLKKYHVHRKYKDRLFRKLFKEKKDLLELYNAINNTAYTNPDELEITTLEDTIILFVTESN